MDGWMENMVGYGKGQWRWMDGDLGQSILIFITIAFRTIVKGI